MWVGLISGWENGVCKCPKVREGVERREGIVWKQCCGEEERDEGETGAVCRRFIQDSPGQEEFELYPKALGLPGEDCRQRIYHIPLVWLLLEADHESRIGVQVIYLGGDSRAPLKEWRVEAEKGRRPTKEAL